MRNRLKDSVVSDCLTPNIKAEVILNALLSPYIEELIPGAKLVAKEMSIPIGERFGSSGPKIDYVLASPEKVYLVELKTTESSFDDMQAEQYLEYCQGKNFGRTLGRQLLTLLDNPKRTFVLHLKDKTSWGDPDTWDEQTAEKVFNAIVEKKRFRQDADGKPPQRDADGKPPRRDEGYYARTARALIQKNGWTQKGRYRSRKYLYTLGRLLDYCAGHPDGLWGKQMEVLYLKPAGDTVKVGGTELPVISLEAFTEDLRRRHPEDDYAQLLAEIVSEFLKIDITLTEG